MTTPTVVRIAPLLLTAVLAACTAAPVTRWNGAYQAADGTLAVVTASEEDTVRYRIYGSGETRRLYPLGEGRYESRVPNVLKDLPDRSAAFGADGTTLDLTREEGGSLQLRRLELPERAVAFESGGVTLRGKLVLPLTPGPHPAVIIAHGSGAEAALPYFPQPYFFAAHGLATLVFDKRGTGTSGGSFGMDFQQLARDVVAGVDWLKAQPGIDARRIGVSGYSQGGWIGPLAASLSPDIRFVIVNYGMIESPAVEETEETLQTLRERGASDAELAEARQLLVPAMTILSTRFRDGWDEFHAVAERYDERAWMERLDDTTIGAFASYPAWMVRIVGPWRMPEGLDKSWNHDSGPILDRLEIPMAWLLGGADLDAPNAQTLLRLKAYRQQGKPYELTVFPDADHGIVQFRVIGGERVYTGNAPGYWSAMVGSARRFAGLD